MVGAASAATFCLRLTLSRIFDFGMVADYYTIGS
jgi:hypothetical protein